ncbi:MAG: hypothetical protein ACFFD4_39715, partial [Candidatus Odinarchaeota archaeon]
NDFKFFNWNKSELKKNFQNLNLVRNQVAHVVEKKDGDIGVLKEIQELNISLSDVLNFCFGLDTIV